MAHEHHHSHEVEIKNVEQLSPTKVKVTIRFSAETVKNHEKMTARQYANSAKIPGFRPGKAPLEMILTRYRDEIRRDLLSHLVDAGLSEGLDKAKVQPISRPKITFKDVPFEGNVAKEFIFDAEFDVPPKIELKKYKGISVKKIDLNVNEEEVSKTIENLRDRLSSLEPTDAVKPEKGFYGQIELAFDFPDVPKKNEAARPYTVELGTGEIFSELDAAVMGMSVGESKTVEGTFPADHQDKEIAGKKVIYSVKLLELKKKKLPEVDDAFAAQIKPSGTVESLKEEIRSSIRSSKEAEGKKAQRDEVLEFLSKSHSFEVPGSMVEGQMQSLLRWMEQDLKRQGVATVNWKETELKEVREKAEKMVRGSLLLREIATKENISLDSAKVDERISQIAVQMNRTLPETLKMLEGRGMLDKIRDEILTDQIFDFLLEQAG